MALNITKGNMYSFITHTWNTCKGLCWHDCTYCYMKRFGNLKPTRFDSKELKTDLGNNNYIFVGSSCDMWSNTIPEKWIKATLEHCNKYPENTYLFQTKNPIRYIEFLNYLPENTILCVTIETDKNYSDIMKNSPGTLKRYSDLLILKSKLPIKTPIYITIEPIMKFDVKILLGWLKDINPSQINIGFDTGNNNLPEPDDESIKLLIEGIIKLNLNIHQKKSLIEKLKTKNIII